MYPTFLIVHSWLRWIVIALGLWTVAAAAVRARAGREGLFFSIALDVQFLVGVLLYAALSPFTRAALADMPSAMRNPEARFWAVEHPSLMVLSVVFVHVGRVVARVKARQAGPGGAPAASRAPLVWYALGLVALLAAVPWPFLSHPRPWLRW